MGVRLNSEKRIENEDFKLKIGTTNKVNPLVIYVEGKAFISPTEEKDGYNKDISEIKHHFKRSISTSLAGSNIFDTKYILDFQVASSGISVNKKSFLSFQFLLRQKGEKIMKLIDVKTASEGMISSIVGSLKETIAEHNFELSKTKK